MYFKNEMYIVDRTTHTGSAQIKETIEGVGKILVPRLDPFSWSKANGIKSGQERTESC